MMPEHILSALKVRSSLASQRALADIPPRPGQALGFDNMVEEVAEVLQDHKELAKVRSLPLLPFDGGRGGADGGAPERNNRARSKRSRRSRLVRVSPRRSSSPCRRSSLPRPRRGSRLAESRPSPTSEDASRGSARGARMEAVAWGRGIRTTGLLYANACVVVAPSFEDANVACGSPATPP